MEYTMEELVPVVGKLAERYTAYESTSITCEKAEQLMGAVLYCIRELEQTGRDRLAPGNRLPAQKAYEIGAVCVEEKTKKALDLYHRILPEFSDYGNDCLRDTVMKGLPEFFKWYNIQFEPQNTILTLDYPVLKDISVYTGVDKIYEFLKCISLEQKFLGKFSENYIKTILAKYDEHYKEMIDNICEVVLLSVTGHILAEKPLTELDLNTIDDSLKTAVKTFLETYFDNSQELSEYLLGSVHDITIRLKNAADNGSLWRVVL